MELYDGRRFVGIVCRIYDKKERRIVRNFDEFFFLHPERENLPIFTYAGRGRKQRIYTVCDVQRYVDAVKAWRDEKDDAVRDAVRYVHEAEIREKDVSGFEAMCSAHDVMNKIFFSDTRRPPTIDETKAEIAKARKSIR